MRLIAFQEGTTRGLAVRTPSGAYHGLRVDEPRFPGGLLELLERGPRALQEAEEVLSGGTEIDLERVQYLPPLDEPPKLLCIGLNYPDHLAETGFAPPSYPTVFTRVNSSLVGHRVPIVRPRLSEQLDYEGEIAVIIGSKGRHIPRDTALEHVAGFTLFNDASVRDYQFKSPQWTLGKNFDATGAFGPEFVSAGELPPGCRGVRLETRLNGRVVQQANVDDLIFDVASLVSILSEVMTLTPGDVIVTGTPAGVGLARKPPLWMKAGDVCEVVSDLLGTLRNPVVDETT